MGSVCEWLVTLLASHFPAHQVRCHCRMPFRVYSDYRRVHHSGFARGSQNDDGRQFDSTRISRHSRLALRLCHLVCLDGGSCSRRADVFQARRRLRGREGAKMKPRGWLFGISLANLLFLYGPIAVLVAFSFNGSRLSATWNGPSLQWYRELFSDYALLVAVQNSMIVATVSTAI